MTDEKDKMILKKYSIENIKLLPENDQDRRMAALLKLQAAKSIQENERERFGRTLSKPMISEYNKDSKKPQLALTKRKVTELSTPRMVSKDFGIVKKFKIPTATETSSSNIKLNVDSTKNSNANGSVELNRGSSVENSKIDVQNTHLNLTSATVSPATNSLSLVGEYLSSDESNSES